MYVLKPICHETIWGGDKLLSYTESSCKRIGHLYALYCREGVSNEIMNGEQAGKSFNDLFAKYKAKWNMQQFEYFPLTLALTEANLNLSIQVHPNDQLANEVEGVSRGKRESWYFIDAPAAGFIYNGCVNLDEDTLQSVVKNENYLSVVDKLYVEKGDYVFVEPGTLHALTEGCLVFEIEEGADATYRFFDYNRLDDQGNARELHVDNALKALDAKAKSTAKKFDRQDCIVEKTYTVTRLTDTASYQNNTEKVQCLMLLEGTALVDSVKVKPGMAVVLEPGDRMPDMDIVLGFIVELN